MGRKPGHGSRQQTLGGKFLKVHGLSRTPEYAAWCAMITRCTNSKQDNFAYYGGRGITICRRWRHSFSNFLADMRQKPTPAHTLDRKNTNGNYTPRNCRWATKKEQANNRRKRRFAPWSRRKRASHLKWKGVRCGISSSAK